MAELGKMLRFVFGLNRMDRIRNESIRGTSHVGQCVDKVKKVDLAGLDMCIGEMLSIGRRMLRMELPGRRTKRSTKRKFINKV